MFFSQSASEALGVELRKLQAHRLTLLVRIPYYLSVHLHLTTVLQLAQDKLDDHQYRNFESQLKKPEVQCLSGITRVVVRNVRKTESLVH
jgi:hypothetical protein